MFYKIVIACHAIVIVPPSCIHCYSNSIFINTFFKLRIFLLNLIHFALCRHFSHINFYQNSLENYLFFQAGPKA